MVKKSKYLLHYISLIAIFIVGNTLIFFPRRSDIKSSILGVIIAAVIAAAVYIVFAIFTKNPFEFSGGKYIIFIFLGLTSFLVSLISSADYLNYITVFRMPYTNRLLISVVFIALGFWLSLQKSSVLLKLSLIAFIYVFLSVTALFSLSFSQLDFKAVMPIEFKPLETIKSLLTILSQSFLSGLLLVFIIKAERITKGIKRWTLGLIFGLFILLVCMINILCIFGPDLSNNLELPYMNAMSVINMGKTFSRLEGFSYLNYFLCSLIKTAAPLYVIRKMAEKFFNKKGVILVGVVCIVLISLSLIYGISDFFNTMLFSVILLIFEALSIIFLGIFQKVKGTID